MKYEDVYLKSYVNTMELMIGLMEYFVFYNGERELPVNTNESTYTPAGHKHRLTNPGATPCVIIEVQSGGYVGEDDIVRFEDQYGRVN